MDNRANLLVVQRVILCLGDVGGQLHAGAAVGSLDGGLGARRGGEDAEPLLLLLLVGGDGAVVWGGRGGGGCRAGGGEDLGLVLAAEVGADVEEIVDEHFDGGLF